MEHLSSVCTVCNVPDEVHCLESLAPAEEPHLVTDVLVILAVVALLAAMMGALGVAVSRYCNVLYCTVLH